MLFDLKELRSKDAHSHVGNIVAWATALGARMRQDAFFFIGEIYYFSIWQCDKIKDIDNIELGVAL